MAEAEYYIQKSRELYDARTTWLVYQKIGEVVFTLYGYNSYQKARRCLLDLKALALTPFYGYGP